MLNLKAIWSKTKPEPAPVESRSISATSVPRQLTPASRADFRPAPPEPAPFSTDTRGAERFVPRRTGTVLMTDGGKKISARIINVSALGVAVEADFSQVNPQSIVMVGERKVKSGRKISRGTVFLFDTPLPKHLCGPDFIV